MDTPIRAVEYEIELRDMPNGDRVVWCTLWAYSAADAVVQVRLEYPLYVVQRVQPAHRWRAPMPWVTGATT